MIIDKILDRYNDNKQGFDGYDFYDDGQYIYNEAMDFGFLDIARAFDSGTNKDCQRVLCDYLVNGYGYDKSEFGKNVCNYVKNVKWVED